MACCGNFWVWGLDFFFLNENLTYLIVCSAAASGPARKAKTRDRRQTAQGQGYTLDGSATMLAGADPVSWRVVLVLRGCVPDKFDRELQQQSFGLVLNPSQERRHGGGVAFWASGSVVQQQLDIEGERIRGR